MPIEGWNQGGQGCDDEEGEEEGTGMERASSNVWPGVLGTRRLCSTEEHRWTQTPVQTTRGGTEMEALKEKGKGIERYKV